MKSIRTCLGFLVFLTSIILPQSLRENLDYVNTQFNKFSSNGIVFNIDTDHKALVIYDDSGTSLCYFEDVQFDFVDESDKSIVLKCIDEEECFDQKVNEEYFQIEKYIIVLNGGNLEKIIKTLNEIKELVLNTD